MSQIKIPIQFRPIGRIVCSGLTLLMDFLSAAVIVGVSLEVAFDYIKVR
ncbi:MAG: hypothetical protein ACJ0BB_03840 [Dehalococcoidia bacterium]